jgi:hypothetical protein
MAPAAAILIGAGITALGNMAANKINANAQEKNAERLSEASKQALEEYKRAYEQSFGKGTYNNQTQAMGIDASKVYQAMLNNPELWNEYINGDSAYVAPEKFSFTADDLYNDPSYQFRLKQGQDALSQNQVAGGLNLSGAAAKQMNDYTQNVASQEYAAAYKRANDQYNADRTFDYTKWLNEAQQYYTNLTNQLQGQNNLMNKGVSANTNQALALQGLAGNTSDSIAQIASAANNANNANAGFMSNTVGDLSSLIGAMFSQFGTKGDTAAPLNSNTGSQNDASLFMNGYNPYLNNGMNLG